MRTVLVALLLLVCLSIARAPEQAHARSSHTRTAGVDGMSIAQTARSYVGYAYDYTSDHPPAFSCVGLVRWVYRQYGIWLPGSVAEMARSYPYVPPQALRPGDLLLFQNTVFWGWSHVAIYIGGGQMVGADNFNVGVHIDSIYDPYWYSHWVSSVRVVW